MSAEQWYYSQNNQPQGPVSFERLRELLATDVLTASDLVWNQGMTSWSEARTIDGLLQRRMAAPINLPPPSSSAVLSLPYGGDFAPASGTEVALSAPEPARRQEYITRELVRFVAFTLLAGGAADWLLFHPLIVPATAVETAKLLWAIGAYLIATFLMAFPVDRWVYGKWYLAEPLGQLLGKRLSVRRHAILTAFVGLLSYLLLLAPLSNFGSVLGSTEAIAIAVFQALLCLTLAYMIVGFWLRGRWPLINKILDALPNSARTLFQGRRMNSTGRHVLCSVGFGAVLFFGGATSFLLPGASERISSAIIGMMDETRTTSDLRKVAWGWIFCSVSAYFPVGYWLNDRWPFAPLLLSIFGEERSVRRRFMLSLALTTPIIIVALISLRLAPMITLVGILPGIIVFGTTYYLMGWTTHWAKTETEAHHVLSQLRGAVPEVRSTIRERMAGRKLPHLEQKEVIVSEPGLYSMSCLDIDISHTEQIQITHKTARVILRVHEFGEDLYIRWESFFDMSGRRLRLLMNLISSIVRHLVYRWTGTEIMEVIETFRNITLPWRKLDTTGEQLRDVAPFASLSSRVMIPSHMLDNLFALEEALNETVTEVLNEVSAANGRKEKVELLIYRSRHQARAQMF